MRLAIAILLIQLALGNYWHRPRQQTGTQFIYFFSHVPQCCQTRDRRGGIRLGCRWDKDYCNQWRTTIDKAIICWTIQESHITNTSITLTMETSTLRRELSEACLLSTESSQQRWAKGGWISAQVTFPSFQISVQTTRGAHICGGALIGKSLSQLILSYQSTNR